MFVERLFTIFVVIFSLSLRFNISLSFLTEGSTGVKGMFNLEKAFMARSTEDTFNPLRRIFGYSQIGQRICRCEYFVGAKKAELACFVTFFYTQSAGKLVGNRVTGWNYRLVLGWGGWRVLQSDSCGAKE